MFVQYLFGYPFGFNSSRGLECIESTKFLHVDLFQINSILHLSCSYLETEMIPKQFYCSYDWDGDLFTLVSPKNIALIWIVYMRICSLLISADFSGL